MSVLLTRDDLNAQWQAVGISATACRAYAGERERSMSYETIIVETHGRVGVIRLNRPQALNALNSTVKAELARAVAEFDADAGIGCMLISGSEKAFAAGADIKEMADKSAVDMFMGDFAGSWHAVAQARKPVIAAVAGVPR